MLSFSAYCKGYNVSPSNKTPTWAAVYVHTSSQSTVANISVEVRASEGPCAGLEARARRGRPLENNASLPCTQIHNGVEIVAAVVQNCTVECVTLHVLFNYTETCAAVGSMPRVRHL
jgi:hypothetical protein